MKTMTKQEAINFIVSHIEGLETYDFPNLSHDFFQEDISVMFGDYEHTIVFDAYAVWEDMSEEETGYYNVELVSLEITEITVINQYDEIILESDETIKIRL
jgi:hypothetical protein